MPIRRVQSEHIHVSVCREEVGKYEISFRYQLSPGHGRARKSFAIVRLSASCFERKETTRKHIAGVARIPQPLVPFFCSLFLLLSRVLGKMFALASSHLFFRRRPNLERDVTRSLRLWTIICCRGDDCSPGAFFTSLYACVCVDKLYSTRNNRKSVCLLFCKRSHRKNRGGR